MYQKFTKRNATANTSSAMESGDHFKNGVNPKDQMSRGNSILK